MIICILGFYWDNNNNIGVILGLYRDNGKENTNYYNGNLLVAISASANRFRVQGLGFRAYDILNFGLVPIIPLFTGAPLFWRSPPSTVLQARLPSGGAPTVPRLHNTVYVGSQELSKS